MPVVEKTTPHSLKHSQFTVHNHPEPTTHHSVRLLLPYPTVLSICPLFLTTVKASCIDTPLEQLSYIANLQPASRTLHCVQFDSFFSPNHCSTIFYNSHLFSGPPSECNLAANQEEFIFNRSES